MSAGAPAPAMARNIALYPWLLVCRNLLFWMPVFFLYFASLVPVEQVLWLEALYYLGVVLLEVPSGYFSDRVGRRATLLIASACWCGAGVVFSLAGGLPALAAGQVLLAAGMAFFSGTDTALHYDSLAALGRAHEFGAQEARARSRGYAAMGIATATGGVLGGVALNWTYALFAVASGAGFCIALALHEPAHDDEGGAGLAPLAQARAVAGRLRHPGLAWLFAYAVVMTVLVHVPYEFLQPYLALLVGAPAGASYSPTPGVSGAAIATMMVLSAIASALAPWLNRRMGLAGLLISVLLLECAIIAAMAAVLHPAVLALVAFRSVPMALSTPVIGAAIHRHLPSGIRATYLSVESLAGRLAFSGTLAVASLAAAAMAGGTALTGPTLARLLWGYLALALPLCVALMLTRGRLRSLDAPRAGLANPSGAVG